MLKTTTVSPRQCRRLACKLSSGKVEENHGCIRATEGEVYIRSGRKELGLEGASRCYIWDGDWVITHVPRDKPYGRHL
jgi:hypothetical protein